jgi:DNA-binding NarL/FixJ family response regulator
MFSIIIIEDNPAFATALTQVIEKMDGMDLLTCFADAETAIVEILAFSPDLVLTDIQLAGNLSGIDIISQLKPLVPTAEFLVCTVYDDNNLVFDALRAGAAGYILKDSSLDEIRKAILEVKAGGAPMSPFIARKVIASFRHPAPVAAAAPDAALTIREKEVLDLLATGRLYKQIAAELQIAYPTVKKHIRNIYAKLHVQNKVEAINRIRRIE